MVRVLRGFCRSPPSSYDLKIIEYDVKHLELTHSLQFLWLCDVDFCIGTSFPCRLLTYLSFLTFYTVEKLFTQGNKLKAYKNVNVILVSFLVL